MSTVNSSRGGVPAAALPLTFWVGVAASSACRLRGGGRQPVLGAAGRDGIACSPLRASAQVWVPLLLSIASANADSLERVGGVDDDQPVALLVGAQRGAVALDDGHRERGEGAVATDQR